ncbi:MAG: polyprenyl diphosphate synthase [Pseudomonadota bacterium]
MTDSADSVAPEQRPRHIAVIMDGNGRWARQRAMPRHFGHRAGVKSVRAVVRRCGELEIDYLTVFAFSSENWSRPREEVVGLMKLFLDALQREVAELHENNVRLRFVGDLSRLSTRLQTAMHEAESLTAGNTGLQLQVAVGYGGRWDILNGCRELARAAAQGDLDADDISEQQFADAMSLRGAPDVDLMIRTGGERRVSNFLLWHMAYAELHFSETLWPDYGAAALDEAVIAFSRCDRRFGRVEPVAHEEVG